MLLICGLIYQGMSEFDKHKHRSLASYGIFSREREFDERKAKSGLKSSSPDLLQGTKNNLI